MEKSEEIFQVIDVTGMAHVVKETSHKDRAPDYKGTGMALCGVLGKGETLDQWIIRREYVKNKNRKTDGTTS